RTHGSIALEADAKHLITDVWTSVGVVVRLAAAAFTGWEILDPLLALAVAVNILHIRVSLLRRSPMGLLNTSLSHEMRTRILDVLVEYQQRGVHFLALLTCRPGARGFISFHVLVPGSWTVQAGHDLLEDIEERVRTVLANSTLFTHLEPI